MDTCPTCGKLRLHEATYGRVTLICTNDCPEVVVPNEPELEGKTCGHGTNSRCDCYGETL
jgi:hypothetical protein